MRENSKHLNAAVAVIVMFLLAGSAWGQASPRPSPGTALSPPGSVWVTPYLGLGFQNKYYDGVVRFSDGGTDLLTIDPGSNVVIGAEVGYRFRRSWTVYGNVATSSPDATYVEDGTLRPDVDLRTTQLEAGLLYDLRTFPVGRKTAPFSIGGGLSLTWHGVRRFTWSGNFVEPTTTSVGAHGLAALDIPLAPKLSFRGQAKWTLSSFSRGDLEEKIALAEGGGVTATLNGGTSSYFVLSAGVTIRL